MNDKSILENLRSEDPKLRNTALRSVYASNFKNVQKLILNNSGNDSDAKDIFQDAIMVLYEKAQNRDFTLTCAIKTFLYAVSKNIWLNKLRKNGKNVQIEKMPDEIAIDPNGLDKLVNSEQQKYYNQLLAKVDKESQRVLKLYYYEKKKMKEIAEIMGYANAQVAKNKKLRCLKKLRTLVSHSELKFIFN